MNHSPLPIELLSNDSSDDDSQPVIVKEIIHQVNKPAGRLKLFRNSWKKITFEKIILNYLTGYKIPFTRKSVQQFPPKPSIFSKKDTNIFQIEIEKLPDKGAIEERHHCEDQFISPFFLVPKSDGSNRFIYFFKKVK